MSHQAWASLDILKLHCVVQLQIPEREAGRTGESRGNVRNLLSITCQQFLLIPHLCLPALLNWFSEIKIKHRKSQFISNNPLSSPCQVPTAPTAVACLWGSSKQEMMIVWEFRFCYCYSPSYRARPSTLNWRSSGNLRLSQELSAEFVFVVQFPAYSFATSTCWVFFCVQLPCLVVSWVTAVCCQLISWGHFRRIEVGLLGLNSVEMAPYMLEESNFEWWFCLTSNSYGRPVLHSVYVQEQVISSVLFLLQQNFVRADDQKLQSSFILGKQRKYILSLVDWPKRQEEKRVHCSIWGPLFYAFFFSFFSPAELSYKLG